MDGIFDSFRQQLYSTVQTETQAYRTENENLTAQVAYLQRELSKTGPNTAIIKENGSLHTLVDELNETINNQGQTITKLRKDNEALKFNDLIFLEHTLATFSTTDAEFIRIRDATLPHLPNLQWLVEFLQARERGQRASMGNIPSGAPMGITTTGSNFVFGQQPVSNDSVVASIEDRAASLSPDALHLILYYNNRCLDHLELPRQKATVRDLKRQISLKNTGKKKAWWEVTLVYKETRLEDSKQAVAPDFEVPVRSNTNVPGLDLSTLELVESKKKKDLIQVYASARLTEKYPERLRTFTGFKKKAGKQRSRGSEYNIGEGD